MRHNRERENRLQIEGERPMKSRKKERRIRLSADTAIQFYDVQDRLGYDRATNAIDWLMKEAKVVIDALGDDNQGYRVPATTTISNPLDTFYPSCYDQNQQNMNPRIRFPQQMNLFSSSKAPLDYPTWNQNDNRREEGGAFVGCDQLGSSLGRSVAHTPNNGLVGFCFEQDIQFEEDEKVNLVVVPESYRPSVSDTSVLDYQDKN